MSQNVNSAQEEASPRRLLPERLSFILDDRPVLWFEDVEAYDALLAGIVAAYDPGGVVEFMLVKDIADTQWECRRLRDLRRAGSEVELPQAAHRLMRECYEEGTGLGYSEARASLEHVVRHAARGDAEAREILDSYAEASGVTYRMMHYEAHKISLKTVSAIEEALSRAERRRDKLIRMFEDRRRTLQAMSRSLLEAAPARGADDDAPSP